MRFANVGITELRVAFSHYVEDYVQHQIIEHKDQLWKPIETLSDNLRLRRHQSNGARTAGVHNIYPKERTGLDVAGALVGREGRYFVGGRRVNTRAVLTSRMMLATGLLR